MNILLKNYTSAGLHRLLDDHGCSLRLARRIQSHIFKTGLFPESLTETSPRTLSALRDICTIPSLKLIDRRISAIDGFAKYLFESHDGVRFESVRIPVVNRKDPGYIICVSSQAGCPLACTFCATGKTGFKRNLEVWEITDQALAIRLDSDLPVRGIVFMGMGEPFLNTEHVLAAADIFSEPCGMAVSAKNISISTAGILEGISQLIESRRKYRLIYSLTSADGHKREALMPVEKANPAQEVMKLLAEHARNTGERITLAWTMISGLNTGEKDARSLKELIGDAKVKIDLIDVNDASGHYRPPGDPERNQFIDYLRLHLGAPVARRYSGGADIAAACGMLVGGI